MAEIEIEKGGYHNVTPAEYKAALARGLR
jgi:hypothetical protein